MREHFPEDAGSIERAVKASLCALCARHVPLRMRPEPLQILKWGMLPNACGAQTPHVALRARCYP